MMSNQSLVSLYIRASVFLFYYNSIKSDYQIYHPDIIHPIEKDLSYAFFLPDLGSLNDSKARHIYWILLYENDIVKLFKDHVLKRIPESFKNKEDFILAESLITETQQGHAVNNLPVKYL
jgi:hypothetical protein